MNTKTKDLETTLRSSLVSFWDDQLQIEPEGNGFAIAMPLLDSSGWQVVVHLAPLTPAQWLLSDHGAILGMLDDAGKRPSSRKLREVIEAQCRFYGFERDGTELRRAVRFPFDPAEIQIFAEGLVSLSHLCPKTQQKSTSNASKLIEDRISKYFYRHNWSPKRHHGLAGRVETDIVVEFYWDGPRQLALQPAGRTRNIRAYMEQWGWRWTDLSRAHPNLVKAMVFDPDSQDWDNASLRIGEEVCDIFVPVSDAETALDEALVAQE